MAENNPFWMVVGNGPTFVRHDTRIAAEREAERLARLHPGASFYVLEAIVLVRKVDVEKISLRHGDDFAKLPFGGDPWPRTA